MGTDAAARKTGGVLVQVANSDREMEAGRTVSRPGRSNHLAGSHGFAVMDIDLGEERVARPDTAAVVDRHRPVANDHSCERDGSAVHRLHGRAFGCQEVDAPVPPVAGSRVEDGRRLALNGPGPAFGNGEWTEEDGERHQQRHGGTVRITRCWF